MCRELAILRRREIGWVRGGMGCGLRNPRGETSRELSRRRGVRKEREKEEGGGGGGGRRGGGGGGGGRVNVEAQSPKERASAMYMLCIEGYERISTHCVSPIPSCSTLHATWLTARSRSCQRQTLCSTTSLHCQRGRVLKDASPYLPIYPPSFPPKPSSPFSGPLQVNSIPITQACTRKDRSRCSKKQRTSLCRHHTPIQGRQVEVTRSAVLGYPGLVKANKEMVSRSCKTMDKRNEKKGIAKMLHLICAPRGLRPSML